MEKFREEPTRVGLPAEARAQADDAPQRSCEKHATLAKSDCDPTGVEGD